MSSTVHVDLRSDTVTRPSPEMRRAMAEAEVGDDVFGDDPTVKRLEAHGAERVGKSAALFVPSGCMANLIAVMAQTCAGDEILVGRNAHIHTSESGSYARLAQVNKWSLGVDAFGRFDLDEVQRSIHIGYGRPGGHSHLPTSRLLCFENTNNFCGGTVQTPEEMRRAIEVARAKAPWMAFHLDGARIFHAAVALSRPVTDFTCLVDTVSFCLSKGLGAPVGSLICGSEELIIQARALRKMLGGGMRQVGVLAACGLIALSEASVGALVRDHILCRRLAEGLAGMPGVRIDLDVVQTNILFFELDSAKGDAGWFVGALAARGVHVLALGDRIRMVLHRDVSAAQVDYALEVAASVLRS